MLPFLPVSPPLTVIFCDIPYSSGSSIGKSRWRLIQCERGGYSTLHLRPISWPGRVSSRQLLTSRRVVWWCAILLKVKWFVPIEPINGGWNGWLKHVEVHRTSNCSFKIEAQHDRLHQTLVLVNWPFCPHECLGFLEPRTHSYGDSLYH
jgi:hypothetical protein